MTDYSMMQQNKSVLTIIKEQMCSTLPMQWALNMLQIGSIHLIDYQQFPNKLR